MKTTLRVDHIARLHSDARDAQIARLARRGAFTIVELLLVIAVISILASLTLFVLRGATEDARAAKTRAQIERIQRGLAGRWENYEARIMPFRAEDFPKYPDDMSCPTFVTSHPNRAQLKRIRERYLAEMIRAEFPYFKIWLDPTDFPSAGSQVENLGVSTDPERANRPDLWPQCWINTFNAVLQSRPPSLLIRYRSEMDYMSGGSFEQAELLYVILQSIDQRNETNLDLLKTDEVLDTDENGFNEVVDAWGDPLEFRVLWVNDATPGSDPYDTGVDPPQPLRRLYIDVQSVNLRVDPSDPDSAEKL